MSENKLLLRGEEKDSSPIYEKENYSPTVQYNEDEQDLMR
jgi:hypothetical protein